MNFFGHAVVATWLRPEVAYVFGSMLPDFAAMIGARLPSVNDARVSSGVRAHHVVDDVFHDLSIFRSLCRSLSARLVDVGFDRGRARAVAHIGVEILLDRPMSEDPSACKFYSEVLEQMTHDGLGRTVAWSDEQTEHFERLRTALRTRRDAVGDAHATTVFRLERALHRRPRLALGPAHCDKVAEWLVGAESSVDGAAAPLVAELKAGLDRRVSELELDAGTDGLGRFAWGEGTG